MIRILFVLLLLAPAVAFSFENEPAGFRSIPWDTPIGTIAGLRPAGAAEGTMRSYLKSDEIFVYEGVTLTDIRYLADGDKFVGAQLTYDCGQRGNLAETLKKNYGAPTRTARGGTFTWQGKMSTITLVPPDAINPVKPLPAGETALCSLTFRSTAQIWKNVPLPKVK
jgi:hypothetical protein